MKFLETLKKYEKLVVEENAKLQSIYNTLINEAKDEGIAVDEDDILKKTPHNGDASHNGHIKESEEEDDEIDEDEEEFETTETVKEDEDGNIELDESDVIDPELMKLWCNQSIEVR